MELIQISCPKCGSGLKLKDRKLLGRRGKCPSCGHAFVLEEPADAEVTLELASESVPTGTGAQWVPDEAPVGRSPGPVVAAALPSLGADATSGTARLQEIRRRTASRRRNAIIAGGLTALAIVGVMAWISSHPPESNESGPAPVASRPAASTSDRREPAVASDSTAMITPVSAENLSSVMLEANAEPVDAVRPTQGEPIQLYMMPSGVNFVIHLRPAQVWGNEPQFQELRATLTQNVTDWIAAKLKETCRRDPEQIDEALIGIILGSRGTDPDVACVVHLKEEAKLSDLIEEFRGEPLREEGGLRLYRADKHAYLIRDAKTIAICPAIMGAELAEWVSLPNHNTTDGMLQLLNYTDRERLFTVLFEVDDVRRHEEWLFPESTLTAFRHVLDAVSDDAETVGWSVHLGDHLHSELHFRTRVAGAQEIMSPRRLAQSLSARLEGAPLDLMSMARQMHPQRAGQRTIIGRFPAMVEAFRQSTVPTTGARHVKLTTVLPAKAAPNLALGTLLTWDEARRTDFSTAAPPPTTIAAADPQLPETVAERLQLTVEAEFRQRPLQDALRYICDEISVKMDIDGDALKDAGYTQNMEQNFNLGTVTAEAAIRGIIDKYHGDGNDPNRMCVVIDESTKTLMLMTKKFAERRGLEPALIAPPKEDAS